ncbi:ATP-binding protein [Candidatus Margulisiibacteriota bacterium]
MKRDIYSQLLGWKKDEHRKPLILKGARQVGKTYILKEFGESEYEDVAYFNFEEDPHLKEFFSQSLSPDVILEKLSIARERIITPEETLIILDEIQESPEALTSLKYFHESAPEYHIIASGSLLGIKLGQDRSFPVGNVNMLFLYPFSFLEYLRGIGKSLIKDLIKEKQDFNAIDKKFHEELIDDLKKFLYIGGMPEVIKRYKEEGDLQAARNLQKEILEGYESDFAKHASKTEAIKISHIWKTIPSQLAKENKKFTFSEIQKHARPRDYNEAIEWLVSGGYIYKSYRVNIPNLPLDGYIEENVFKLFMMDTGLLCAMLDLTPKTIVEGNSLFAQYNGAVTENYIAQELIKNNFKNLYYWTSGSTAEVDFLVPYQERIYPLEVKSGKNAKAKSLQIYNKKYQPDFASRISPLNFNKVNELCDYPLYAISQFPIT